MGIIDEVFYVHLYGEAFNSLILHFYSLDLE